MSGSYSKFEQNIGLNFLHKEELPSVLKNEVELVRGTRSKSKLHHNDQDWSGGGGDSGAKVFEMKLRVLRGSRAVSEKDPEEYNEMKTESIKLFKEYCITHRVPLLPEDVRFVKQMAGGEERKSGGGRSSKTSGVGKSPRGSKNSEAVLTTNRASGGGAGGGDGKRPPPSSSEPDSPWTETEVETTEQETTNTETTDATPSEKFGRKKSSMRKSKLPRLDDTETSGVELPSPSFPFEREVKKEPTPNFRRSTLQKKRSTNLSLYRYTRQSRVSSPRFSTLNRISVHSYKPSGKLASITQLDKKLSSQQRHLFPNKTTPIPRPFENTRKKMRAEMKARKSSFTSLFDHQSPTEPETKTVERRSTLLSFSEALSFTGQDDSLFSTTKQTQINHPHVPQRRSKVGLWAFQAKKLRSPRLGPPIRPSVVTSVSDVQKIMNAERTDEWLEWTSSEHEEDENLISENEPEEDSKSKDVPHIQPDLKAFINSTRILEKINSAFGLCPFTKVVRKNSVQVLWDRRSWKYVYLSLNSIFYFMTTLFIFISFLAVLRYDKPLPSSQQIIKVTFAHHFLESLFLTLLNLFLTVYSISLVFSMGAHYAEFYSRFNLGICLTKYNVSEGVHEMIVRHLGGVIIFETVMVFLFFIGRMNVPIVRESCGFLGYTLLRQFNNNIRESVYYPLVEIFGLIVFLHCFFCFNVVLLQFAVYARALENMAGRFNIKLAFAFGAIVSTKSSRQGESADRMSTKAIPYTKLYAEHRVITSLIRMLTDVNYIVFGTFLFCMVCEIALIMWLFFDLFLEMHLPSLKNVNAHQAGELELAVPLRLQKEQVERVMKTVVIFGITWLTYWGFGNTLHRAGDALLAGGDFVRRHGLTRCRSSKERRFIISMITSFSPKNLYWVGKRKKFNRVELMGLMGFVIGTSMVTVSFRPERLELSSVETCSKFGFCNEIKVSKYNAHRLYAVLDLSPSPAPPPTGNPMPDTTEPSGSTSEVFKLDSSLFLWKPPCGSFGTYPVKNNDFTFKCPANWSFNSQIELPHFYKAVKILKYDFHKKMIYTFITPGNLTEPFRCRTANNSEYDFGSPDVPISDCFGSKLDMETLDDCHNPPLSSLDTQLVKWEAVAKPILTSDLQINISKPSIICCYEYPGLENSKNQLKSCNIPDAPTFLAACKLGTDRRRMMEHPHLLQHYNRISFRIRYEMEIRNNSDWFQLHQETIQKCLCKLKDPQPALDSDEHCHCTGLQMLPCVDINFFTTEFTPDDYSLQCGPVRVPLLFKTDPETSLNFHAKHHRYRFGCNEPAFRDRFDHTSSLLYPNPCSPPPSASKNFTLVDCAGNPITSPLETDDDCSSWKIKTPDDFGEMLPPILTLREFNYDKNSKKIVETESNSTIKSFLCCYQYANPVFQTAAQDRYCNVPDMDSMTNSAWCGRIVSYNGRRYPGQLFKGEKYEQLVKKLEQSVRYHAGNRVPWLERTTINQKWVRCICPDKIGLDELLWEQERLEECKPLIPSPQKLFTRRIIQPFPLCKHSWPTTPGIPSKIMTPAPFIFQFGIWEMANRFKKIGGTLETNPCLLDQNYDERYKNDGNPRLYDLLLNELPQGYLDDCSSLPLGSDGAPPKLLLIAVNQITTFGKNDDRFFCCFQYARSTENQVNVCNMPNKQALEKKCKLSASSLAHLLPYVQRLQENRRVGSGMRDDLASNVGFNDPARILWTKCLCERDESACREASPLLPPPRPPPPPRCFRFPGTEAKFFTHCKSVTKTGEWASLQYISYPTIFQKQGSSNSYHQVMPIEQACNPDANGTPLPAGTLTQVATTAPVFDCSETKFQHGSQYFEDECSNPILVSDGKMLKIRVTVLDELRKKVACCVDYGLGNSRQSRQQALVCNKPSEELRNSQCIEKEEVRLFRRYAIDLFFNKWNKYKSDELELKRFESDSYVVRCMCDELPYVKMKYPKMPIIGIGKCISYISKFK